MSSKLAAILAKDLVQLAKYTGPLDCAGILIDSRLIHIVDPEDGAVQTINRAEMTEDALERVRDAIGSR